MDFSKLRDNIKLDNLIQKIRDYTDYLKNGTDKEDIERRKRILALAKEGDYGLCPPPMDDETALNELYRYFLGDKYYVVMSMGRKQTNTQMVYDIECRYKGYNG